MKMIYFQAYNLLQNVLGYDSELYWIHVVFPKNCIIKLRLKFYKKYLVLPSNSMYPIFTVTSVT